MSGVPSSIGAAPIGMPFGTYGTATGSAFPTSYPPNPTERVSQTRDHLTLPFKPLRETGNFKKDQTVQSPDNR